MIENGTGRLNIAAVVQGTTALGPGLRAVVWVQGCPFHCPGCIAPDWISFRPGRMMTPAELSVELLTHPDVTGLTFSGGEPMAQAAGLAQLARLARQKRELDIICFSGFTLEKLRQSPPFPGVTDLLEQVDVLIDGPYIAEKNDNRGLRGSSNQHIHYLTERLSHVDFDSLPRQAEIQVRDGHLMVIGVPPKNLINALDSRE